MRYLTTLVGMAMLCANVAFAQDVTLSSRDGKFSIDGTLLSFDGEFYRVETVYGPLTLDGEGVNCEGPGCPDLNAFVADVRFSGTRLMADILVPALFQAFADRNGLQLTRDVASDTQSTFLLSDEDRLRARFALSATTTSEGYADLIAEEADIALVIRAPNSREVEMAGSSGAGSFTTGRRARVIALDGMVGIVALEQPKKSLTHAEFSAIFSGETRNWTASDGDVAQLVVQLPPEGSSLRSSFQDHIFGSQTIGFAPNAQVQDSLESVADSVANDSFSIGLTTLSQTGNADPVSLVGSCGIEQLPSLTSLKSEDYPLTVPLMMVTPARRLPALAREFLEFTSSPAADVVIRRAGFVDQGITRSRFNMQGDRLGHAISLAGEEVPFAELQRLVRELRNRERLSTTFRFETGTKLDLKSQENILRLAAALETGAYDDRSILFVGFSDSLGPAEPNRKLAYDRASLVLAQIRDAAKDARFDRLSLNADAFGEALPIACDDTDWGRAINRRVEVWIR